MDKCGKHFVKVAVVLTALALIGALVMMSFLYAAFAPKASCARNICFITFTLLICIALVALTVVAAHMHPGGCYHTNLLTVGFLCPYLFWLCATALASSPDDECSPGPAQEGSWFAVRCNFACL